MKNINYFLLIYPALCLLTFFVIFIVPAGAMFLLLVSPYLLLKYIESPLRTRFTDYISISFLLISLIFGFEQSLYFILVILLPMLFLAYDRRTNDKVTYLPELLSALPITVIFTFFLISSPDFLETIQSSLRSFLDALVAPLQNSSERLGDYGMLSYIMANKERAIVYMTYLIPSTMYVTISLFVFLVDKIIPVYRGDKFYFRDFRLPDNLVFILVAGFLVISDNLYLKLVAYNVLISIGILYFFQGVQIMSIVFDRLKVSRFFRLLVYALLFTEPPIILMLSIFGLSSIWFRPSWSLRSEKGDKVE